MYNLCGTVVITCKFQLFTKYSLQDNCEVPGNAHSSQERLLGKFLKEREV